MKEKDWTRLPRSPAPDNRTTKEAQKDSFIPLEDRSSAGMANIGARYSQEELDILSKRPAEKIASAQALKEKGNEFFKAQNFKKALLQYNTGIAYTERVPGRVDGLDITPEEKLTFRELEVILKTNISTCHIKLKNGPRAIEAAKQALALNPKYWKAALRIAEATLLIGVGKVPVVYIHLYI